MAPHLHYISALHHHYPIRIDYRRQSMRNHYYSRLLLPTQPSQIFDRRLNHLLTIGVQRWSSLVENYNFWFTHQCPGNCYSLPLAPTQTSSSLSDLALKAFWKLRLQFQKFHAAGSFSSTLQVFDVVVLQSINNIFLNSSRKERGILIDEPNLLS